MDRMLPCCALLVLSMAVLSAGQRSFGASSRGGREGGGLNLRQQLERGAQHEESAGSAIKAANRDAHAEQAQLEKHARRQARLDRRAKKEERRRLRKSKNAANRLKAAKSLDYEAYDNDAEFHELDAKADKSAANKFGLSIISENRHDETAAISESSGSKANSGVRLAHDEFIDGEEIFQEEIDEAEEAYNGEEISAADAGEDLFSAQELFNKESESQLAAQNVAQQRGLFHDAGFAGEAAGFGADFGQSAGIGGLFGGGGGGIFGGGGNNIFGKRK